jgi:hypothetical protein
MRSSIATDEEDRTFMNGLLQTLQNGLDDPKEIVWSRMGVFEPVEKSLFHISQLVNGQIVSNKKDTKYVFEESITEKGVRLRPEKYQTGITYKTSKFGKTKNNGVISSVSHLQISPHALQRIHQRSGYREITSQDIWERTDCDWTKELSRFSRRYKKGQDVANLWLVPYGRGAFIVTPYESTVLGLSAIHKPQCKKDRIEVINDDGYGLTAITYIDKDNMFRNQRQIVECIMDKQYKDAWDIIFA